MINRRNFLETALLLGSTTAVAPQLLYAGSKKTTGENAGKNFTFLFQGDSITDGARSRNNDWNHLMGHGYVYLVSSRLWFSHPAKEFHFLNRGVGGNTIVDMQARWQADTLDIKPDLLSILIGVNDTSHWIKGDKTNTVEQFETVYRSLLQKTKEQFPAVQLVLCEPFILPVGKVKEKWEEHSIEIKKRQEIVSRLSKEFNAIYVEFQEVFNKALSKAPAEYWIWDGVHPMPAGHELMAREWIQQVSKKIKFIK